MLHSLVKLNVVSNTRDSADTGGEKCHGMSGNWRTRTRCW